MKLKNLFYHGHEEVDLKKELANGLYLFIIALVMIQWNADLLRTSFETNIFNAVIPVLLFMLCGFSGLFSVVQGLLFKKPLMVLPNLMLTVLISVYGTYAFGHSISHTMIAAFIATVISFFIFLFLSEKQLRNLFPESILSFFPLALGFLLVLFGSIKAGLLVRFLQPAPSTLVSATALSEWHFPFRMGNFLQPIPIMVMAGFLLFGLSKKKSILRSPLTIFFLLTIIGFFIPIEWGRSQLKGMVTSFQPFSFITSNFVPSNFNMFFTNWNLSAVRGAYDVLSSTPSLIKLVFLFLVTFVFSNLYQLHTCNQLINTDGEGTEGKESHSLKMKPMIYLNHLFSILGVGTNVTFFMTGAESGVAMDQSSRSGFSAVFGGLLLLATACMIPLGFFSSQAGAAFLMLFFGFSLIQHAVQPILKQKAQSFLSPIIFILVTLFTFNPAEGLVITILIEGLQRILSGIQQRKYDQWKDLGFLLLFVLSLLYVVFYIVID
jgi:xanthine/uracil/vitamin C permease (AzgA family)